MTEISRPHNIQAMEWLSRLCLVRFNAENSKKKMKQKNERTLILVKAADKAHKENVAEMGKETSTIKTNYNNLH